MRKCGNYGDAWLQRLVEFLDLYCIGAIICDLVDFSRIERRHYMYQQLIHNGEETELITDSIQNGMSETCQRVVDSINTVNFGDETMPQNLQNYILGIDTNLIEEVAQNLAQEDEVYEVNASDDVESDLESMASENARLSTSQIFNKLQLNDDESSVDLNDFMRT